MSENGSQITRYEIKVRGHLDDRWSEWFDGMDIRNLPGGDTILYGMVIDQAALHGLLIKIRDLGLPLVSVHTSPSRHAPVGLDLEATDRPTVYSRTPDCDILKSRLEFNKTDNKEKLTEMVKRRYAKIASFYDLMDNLTAGSNESKWRQLSWSKAEGSTILEIGIGTGRNFPYYPSGVQITGIDFSDNMLKQARNKAIKQNIQVQLSLMDIQKMEFTDNTFDSVVGTFIFCTVPDPIRGLAEVKRVLRPGGKLVLLEHVISDNHVLAWIMNLLNPIVLRVGGGNINRHTVDNVAKSGLVIEKVTTARGINKLIEARKRV